MPWLLIGALVFGSFVLRGGRAPRLSAGPRAETLALLARLVWQIGVAYRTAMNEVPDGSEEDVARATLGVPADATRSTINEAYRRLMRAAHPDRGGDPDMASRLNRARDCLLRNAAA